MIRDRDRDSWISTSSACLFVFHPQRVAGLGTGTYYLFCTRFVFGTAWVGRRSLIFGFDASERKGAEWKFLSLLLSLFPLQHDSMCLFSNLPSGPSPGFLLFLPV